MANEPAPPVPPVPPAPPATPWYTGKLDAELIGHMQTHGWHEGGPEAAALGAVKAHREAQKLIGVPADQIIRLPAQKDDATAWSKVWQRLGAPDKPEGYDFSSVKRAGGKPLEKPLEDVLRSAVAKHFIPKDAAVTVASELVKHLDQTAATAKAESDARIAEGRQNLDRSWGTNKDGNLFKAQNALKAVGKAAGLDEAKVTAAITALEGTAGYEGVMQMFLAVGQKMGEDTFVAGGGQGGGGGVLTREQAVSRKADLMADTAFVEKYLNSDAQAIREMTALDIIIVGGDDTNASRR